MKPQPPSKLTADHLRSRHKTTDERLVWFTASRLTRSMLETYGNVVSPDHWRAIQSLADLFTAVTFGAIEGRFAVGMPTGTGKTMSAVGFIVALHQHQRPESVVVCAEKVAQLINFKRELVKWGVPESEIGLWYSDDYRTPDGSLPSEPRTPEPESRRYLLLTHTRTRNQKQLEQMNTFGFQTRSLWIWDESLLSTAYLSLDYLPLRAAVSWLGEAAHQFKIRSRYPRVDRERRTRLLDLVSYLKSCLAVLERELEAQEKNDRTPSVVTLPEPPSPSHIETWRLDLRPLYGRSRSGRALIHLIQKLLRTYNQRIRLVSLDESVIVTFEVSVNPQLQRMVVLDASYSIRVLENMDKGIQHVADFESIKDWSDVTFTFEKGPSGRGPISSDFTEAAAWAIEKIRQYPPTDPILLLTFKDRPDSEDQEEGERRLYRRGETQMVAKFRQALQEANVPDPERVKFLTFGNETSLSDYKHIPHVIFLGVLHRSQTDLSGACLSAEGDLLHTLTNEDVYNARLSEQAHGIYQGASRGTCRILNNGKALPQTVDLRHFDPWSLAERLRPVTRNAVYNLPPEPTHADKTEYALQVLDVLAKVEGNTISRKALKKLSGLTHLRPHYFAAVVAHAMFLRREKQPQVPAHLLSAPLWKAVEGSRSLARA